MKKTMLLASAAMFGVVLLAANVTAQGVPQTVEITKVDVQKWQPAIGCPRLLVQRR